MSAARRTEVIRLHDNYETSSSPPSKGSTQASRAGLEDKVVNPGHGLVASRVAKPSSPPLKAPLPASPFVASAPPVAACDGAPTTRASPQLSLGSTVSPGHGVLAAARTSCTSSGMLVAARVAAHQHSISDLAAARQPTDSQPIHLRQHRHAARGRVERTRRHSACVRRLLTTDSITAIIATLSRRSPVITAVIAIRSAAVLLSHATNHATDRHDTNRQPCQ